MTEANVLPWIEVNEMMDDEYRQLVVAEALGHYPKASPELNKFASEVFRKTIQVNGFRSFQSIPAQMAKIHVLKEFRNNEHVAEAVICLWAEKQHELIESLAQAAREAKIPVPESRGWQQARYGFVQGEDTPEFDKLATELSAQKSKPESDHYLLAALWLSYSLHVE